MVEPWQKFLDERLITCNNLNARRATNYVKSPVTKTNPIRLKRISIILMHKQQIIRQTV